MVHNLPSITRVFLGYLDSSRVQSSYGRVHGFGVSRFDSIINKMHGCQGFVS